MTKTSITLRRRKINQCNKSGSKNSCPRVWHTKVTAKVQNFSSTINKGTNVKKSQKNKNQRSNPVSGNFETRHQRHLNMHVEAVADANATMLRRQNGYKCVPCKAKKLWLQKALLLLGRQGVTNHHFLRRTHFFLFFFLSFSVGDFSVQPHAVWFVLFGSFFVVVVSISLLFAFGIPGEDESQSTRKWNLQNHASREILVCWASQCSSCLDIILSLVRIKRQRERERERGECVWILWGIFRLQRVRKDCVSLPGQWHAYIRFVWNLLCFYPFSILPFSHF